MLEAGGGKIVNVAPFAGTEDMAQMGAYCARKRVVIGLTEAISAELRVRGISFNCVLPATLDTPDNPFGPRLSPMS